MTAKVDAILVANGIKPAENHLAQYGVRGMKWGVRKRRSASVDLIDRSGKRTPIKYDPKKTSVSKDGIVSTSKREAKSVQKQIDRTKVPNTFKNKPQNRRMSDAELRSKLNRLQMEKQFKELTANPSPKGKSFVRDVLEDTGKQVARQVVKTSANVALEMAFRSLAKDAKAGSFVAEMAAQVAKKKK